MKEKSCEKWMYQIEPRSHIYENVCASHVRTILFYTIAASIGQTDDGGRKRATAFFCDSS